MIQSKHYGEVALTVTPVLEARKLAERGEAVSELRNASARIRLQRFESSVSSFHHSEQPGPSPLPDKRCRKAYSCDLFTQ